MKAWVKTWWNKWMGGRDGSPLWGKFLQGDIRKLGGQTIRDCHITWPWTPELQTWNSLNKSNSAAKGRLWTLLIEEVTCLKKQYLKAKWGGIPWNSLVGNTAKAVIAGQVEARRHIG